MAGHFGWAVELSEQLELGLNPGNLVEGVSGDMPAGDEMGLVPGRDCTVMTVSGEPGMIPLNGEELGAVVEGLDLDNLGERLPLGSHS